MVIVPVRYENRDFYLTKDFHFSFLSVRQSGEQDRYNYRYKSLNTVNPCPIKIKVLDPKSLVLTIHLPVWLVCTITLEGYIIFVQNIAHFHTSFYQIKFGFDRLIDSFS